MPTVCSYRRSTDRRRTITPSDAARFVCGALDNPGVSQDEIELLLVERDCGWEREDPECDRKRRQAKEAALGLVEANNQVIGIAEAALAFIAIQLVALLGLIRLVPLVGPPASLVVRQVQGRIATVSAGLVARRAANDAVFRLVSGL